MLRHRIRSVLIVCPSGLQIQWREQMCDKFGLDFRIIDSDAMKHLRRSRGLHVNPSPGDVANILRGAAHAMAAERRRQQVELVWSGPTTLSSTLRSTGSALLDLIRGARQSVCLVTFAAYKVPDVVEIIGVVKGPKT